LQSGPQTARDLSSLLSITERDVISHLEHLQRSLQQQGVRLMVEPAECQACEFRFERRKRLSRPGACPRCRSTWIAPPVFRIDSGT
jgi:predicted Zn-ribbon and HTH transcriptional regulator